jgi:signal transduction histidine kinase
LDQLLQHFILDTRFVIQSTQGYLLKRLALPSIEVNDVMAPWLRQWTGLHLKRLCEPVLSGGKTVLQEAELQQNLQHPCRLLIKVEPLVRKARVAGVVLTLQDVTAERKLAADRQLSEQLQILSGFVAPLVELIHLPVSSIQNRIGMVLQYRADGAWQDNLESIQDQLYRLNQITTALQGLVQNPDHHRRLVDVHRTVEKAVAVVRLLFSRRDIEFDLQPEPGRVRVHGNEVTLEQALIHVLQNGAESMPNGGVVFISSRFSKSDNCIYIEIRDQGGGMTRAECQQALLPFYRTKPGDHIGLGLTTAFRIVEVHGGGMDLTSKPGEGTTVTIRLPVESRQA